jgi:hypothetical protein
VTYEDALVELENAIAGGADPLQAVRALREGRRPTPSAAEFQQAFGKVDGDGARIESATFALAHASPVAITAWTLANLCFALHTYREAFSDPNVVLWVERLEALLETDEPLAPAFGGPVGEA